MMKRPDPRRAPLRQGAPPSNRDAKGFTLTELLAVIAVLVVLAALLVPSLSDMLHRVRTVICASRLHNLGTAYHARAADVGLRLAGLPMSSQYNTGGTVSAADSNEVWPAAMLKYVDEESRMYVCPEDARLATYTLPDFGPPQQVQNKVDLGEYAFCGHYPLWNDALEPGPLREGLDEGRTHFFAGGGYAHWMAIPINAYHYRIWIDPYRLPSGDPYPYAGRRDPYLSPFPPAGYDWLTDDKFVLDFESYSDYDWNDLNTVFTRRADGTVLVEISHNDSGTTYSILDTYGGVLVPVEGMKDMHNVRPFSRTAVLYPRGWVDGQPPQTQQLRDVEISYGINPVAHSLGASGEKILFVEYDKNLADVVGPAAADNWAEHVAPRHRGQCHILCADGCVRLVDPQDIDPTVAANHDLYWKSDDIPPMVP